MGARAGRGARLVVGTWVLGYLGRWVGFRGNK